MAAGRLFETIFQLPYLTALLFGAVVVVFYTLVGGFLAVSRTDFIQGVMMFFAILVVPVGAALMLGGFSATADLIHAQHAEFFAPLTKPDGSTLGFIEFISLMGWGLGYFGQPHILVRFMAIRHAEELPQATRIAMSWVVISLSAAILVGMVGAVYLKTPLAGTATETVFLTMAGEVFVPKHSRESWSG